MEPGRTMPLSPSEIEQAFACAPNETACGWEAFWEDSNGRQHRDDDLPSVVHLDGTQEWHQHGKRHRDGDLPACIYKDGALYWWQYGEVHRDGDLPAVLHEDGSREWCQRGKMHRGNNLPAFIRPNGEMIWAVNDVKTGDQDNPPPGALFPGQQTKSASKQI